MPETGTRTVERALTLLAAVAEDGGTLSQLARAAELSPSTASRLLARWRSASSCAATSTARYHAGTRLRQLAAATLRADPLYELAGAASGGARRRDRRDRQPGGRRRRPAGRVPAPGREPQARPDRGLGRAGRSHGAGPRSATRSAARSTASGYVARTGAVEPDVTSIAAPVYGAGRRDRRRAQRARAELPRCRGGASRHVGGRWRVTPRELSRSLGAPGAAAA